MDRLDELGGGLQVIGAVKRIIERAGATGYRFWMQKYPDGWRAGLGTTGAGPHGHAEEAITALDDLVKEVRP